MGTYHNENVIPIIYKQRVSYNQLYLATAEFPRVTVGRQLPPMPLPPTKMADAPSGRNKQFRFFASLLARWLFLRFAPDRLIV